MKYQVTFENEDQYVIESDLPLIQFAKNYSATADIHPLVVEDVTESKSVVEDVTEPKVTPKRKKVTQDAE